MMIDKVFFSSSCISCALFAVYFFVVGPLLEKLKACLLACSLVLSLKLSIWKKERGSLLYFGFL